MTEHIRIVEAHLYRNGMPESRRIFQFQIFFFHLYAIIKQIHNQTAANLYAKIRKDECIKKKLVFFAHKRILPHFSISACFALEQKPISHIGLSANSASSRTYPPISKKGVEKISQKQLK